MYLYRLLDCSKGNFNRESLKTVVRSRVDLYCIEKENIGLTLKEVGRGSALNANLTLSNRFSDDP